MDIPVMLLFISIGVFILTIVWIETGVAVITYPFVLIHTLCADKVIKYITLGVTLGILVGIETLGLIGVSFGAIYIICMLLLVCIVSYALTDLIGFLARFSTNRSRSWSSWICKSVVIGIFSASAFTVFLVAMGIL